MGDWQTPRQDAPIEHLQAAAVAIVAVQTDLERIIAAQTQTTLGVARQTQSGQGNALVEQLYAGFRTQFVAKGARQFARAQRILPNVYGAQHKYEPEHGFEHALKCKVRIAQRKAA